MDCELTVHRYQAQRAESSKRESNRKFPKPLTGSADQQNHNGNSHQGYLAGGGPSSQNVPQPRDAGKALNEVHNGSSPESSSSRDARKRHARVIANPFNPYAPNNDFRNTTTPPGEPQPYSSGSSRQDWKWQDYGDSDTPIDLFTTRVNLRRIARKTILLEMRVNAIRSDPVYGMRLCILMNEERQRMIRDMINCPEGQEMIVNAHAEAIRRSRLEDLENQIERGLDETDGLAGSSDEHTSDDSAERVVLDLPLDHIDALEIHDPPGPLTSTPRIHDGWYKREDTINSRLSQLESAASGPSRTKTSKNYRPAGLRTLEKEGEQMSRAGEVDSGVGWSDKEGKGKPRAKEVVEEEDSWRDV
jgi:hypothetical protein